MKGTLYLIIFKGKHWWFELKYTCQAIAYEMHATMPTTIPYSLGTLAFERSMRAQVKIKVNWEFAKKIRQDNMKKHKINKNKK